MKFIFSLVIDKPSYWSSISIFNYLFSFLKHSGEKGRKNLWLKFVIIWNKKIMNLTFLQSLNL